MHDATFYDGERLWTNSAILSRCIGCVKYAGHAKSLTVSPHIVQKYVEGARRRFSTHPISIRLSPFAVDLLHHDQLLDSVIAG